MSKYNTKTGFMIALDRELAWNTVSDREEILSDFEQHFTAGKLNGLTEAQVCENLGDITEIAKQYVTNDTSAEVTADIPKKDDNISATVTVGPLVLEEIEDIIVSAPVYEAFIPSEPEQIKIEPEREPTENTFEHEYSGWQNTKTSSSRYENSGIHINISGLISCILLDLLVFSWCLPALASIIISFCSASVGLVIKGIGTLFGGVFDIFKIFNLNLSFLGGIFGGIMLIALGGLMILVSIKMVKGFINIIKKIINWHGKVLLDREIFKSNTEMQNA